MTFLPIVERELRVAARKVTTHRIWLLSAASAIAIFFILLVLMEGPSRIQQVGGRIFVAISILAFLFTLLAGVFLTADCLCSERKEGTLGLLFLTDLRGYDVVLGKLVATSMVGVYTVLAVIPILGVPLMMGGVTGAEFGRVVLSLLTTLLFSLSLGMFASAVSPDTRAAMLLSFGVIAGLSAMLFVFTWLAADLLRPFDAAWLLLPSPILSFTRAFDGWYQFRAGASQFWVSVVSLCGLSAGLLGFASLWLPRSWRDDYKRPPVARMAARTTRRSTQSLEASPYAWLAGRDGFPGSSLVWTLGVLGVAWLSCAFGSLMFNGADFRKLFAASFLAAFGAHVLMKGLMAIQSTRRLCEERRSGALELLLATPLEPVQIQKGQRDVFHRQFKPFVWVLTLMNVVLFLVMSVNYPQDFDGDDVLMFGSFFSGGALLAWVNLHAIGWVGMWIALRGQRPHRAALSTISRVLLVPWLALFLFIVSSANGGISQEAIVLCWFLWMLLCITTSSMAAAKSKRELNEQFRAMAAGEFPLKQSAESRPWSPEWSGAGTPKQVSHAGTNSRSSVP